ncbi:MAG TPA: hypothetical protein VMB53_11430, partial [Gaiellaceae bacterium]|nr:hypothetical protein [Gaiellaceae bacterium]
MILALVVVLAGVVAASGAAGPQPHLCGMDTARGAVPSNYVVDVCIDASRVYIRNTLKVPLRFGTTGALSNPTRYAISTSLAAAVTRREYPDALSVMPGDVLTLNLGTGAATLFVADTSEARYYLLTETVISWIPVVGPVVGLVSEISDDFDSYARCSAGKGTLTRL